MKRFANAQSRVTAAIRTQDSVDETKPIGVERLDIQVSAEKGSYGGIPKSKLPVVAKMAKGNISRRDPIGARRSMQAAGGAIMGTERGIGRNSRDGSR